MGRLECAEGSAGGNRTGAQIGRPLGFLGGGNFAGGNLDFWSDAVAGMFTRDAPELGDILKYDRAGEF